MIDLTQFEELVPLDHGLSVVGTAAPTTARMPWSKCAVSFPIR